MEGVGSSGFQWAPVGSSGFQVSLGLIFSTIFVSISLYLSVFSAWLVRDFLQQWHDNSRTLSPLCFSDFKAQNVSEIEILHAKNAGHSRSILALPRAPDKYLCRPSPIHACPHFCIPKRTSQARGFPGRPQPPRFTERTSWRSQNTKLLNSTAYVLLSVM